MEGLTYIYFIEVVFEIHFHIAPQMTAMWYSRTQ